MPQPLFLHIRPRGRGATHVLELSSDSIRVGRASVCEVRLDDPSLAEVECFLRSRGETWHVQPLSPKGRMSIDGRPVTHLRALATNVPLHVGDATLVLRHTAHVAPAFGAIEVPAATQQATAVSGGDLLDDERLGDRTYEPAPLARPVPAPTIPVPRSSPPVVAPAPRPRIGSPERTWEQRWRAVGRSLKLRPSVAGDVRSAARPPSMTPPDEPATIPFARREAPREPRDEQRRDVAPSPADARESQGTDVCWAMPTATPDAILQASTECTPFEDSARACASTVVDPAHRSSPPADSPSTTGDIDRDPAIPAPHAPEIVADFPLVERPPRTFDEEWPSVRSILQAQAVRRVAPGRSRGETKRRPNPTDATAPAHWSPPLWLVALPMAGAVLVLGAIGVFFGATWGEDDRQAGLLADRLLRAAGPGASPISEDDVNPDGSWWRTTANHLAIRAAALGSSRGDTSRDESARFLLHAARVAAPLEPATRMARAERAATDRGEDAPLAALGLSRDTLALALTARALARDGKTAPALVAYRSALDLAVRGDVGRSRAPAFLDEPNAKRFSLPFEGLIAGVIREMSAQPGWTYETWASSLPEHGLVLLAAYRVLNERGAIESEAVLNRLVESPAAPASGSQALHSVARAEGLALKGRWEEAATLYADAIAAMPDEPLRRSWHLNRGVILARNGQTDQAADAMASARAGRGDDEIGRKVSQAMSREGLGHAPTTASRTSPSLDFKTN